MTEIGAPQSGVGSSFLISRIVYFLPIVVFVGLAIALGRGLTNDPRILPSTLLDKPVPAFDLPAVRGRALGLSNSDLSGEISLVNVFASWCLPCRAEHPLLMRLSAESVVVIHGLNYKDKPDEAAAWLDKLGDPYARTGADLDGRVGIDWGVYGVPETFVVGKDGRIAYKHIGPITPKDLRDTILPIIARLGR